MCRALHSAVRYMYLVGIRAMEGFRVCFRNINLAALFPVA